MSELLNLSKWGSSRVPISLFWFCNVLLRTLRKTVCYVCNRIVFHSNVTRTSKCWEKLTWNVTLCWGETSFSYIPFFPRGINCYKYSKCHFLIQSCITILIFFPLFLPYEENNVEVISLFFPFVLGNSWHCTLTTKLFYVVHFMQLAYP